MDKETAVAIEQLKAEDRAKDKRIELLEKEHEAWNLLIRNTIIKTVSWLVMVGTAGFLYGLHLLPENVRRALTDWASK